MRRPVGDNLTPWHFIIPILTLFYMTAGPHWNYLQKPRLVKALYYWLVWTTMKKRGFRSSLHKRTTPYFKIPFSLSSHHISYILSRLSSFVLLLSCQYIFVCHTARPEKVYTFSEICDAENGTKPTGLRIRLSRLPCCINQGQFHTSENSSKVLGHYTRAKTFV